MDIIWSLKKFEALTAAELYAIMQLRNEVFVVEQNCVYQDADGKDPDCWHFMGWHGTVLTASTRIIPVGVCYNHAASIGRVVTSPKYRAAGIGRQLMQLSIQHTFMLFNCNVITIGAQQYLQKFYESLNFVKSSETYLEDNIPHIEMQLVK